MRQLPGGYVERPWRLEDAALIATMINAYTMHSHGRETVEVEGFAARMQAPGLNLETDTCLVEARDGTIAAVGYAIDFADFRVQVQAEGMVRHEDQGRGIGSWLADWIEARSREAIEKAPADVRVTVLQMVDDSDVSARALLEAKGYKDIRQKWRMLMTFSEDRPTPAWPEGISIRCFDPDVDLEATFLASRDAFKDHWADTDSSEEEGLKSFRHHIRTNPDFDPSLWYLAWDGSEIAGICRARPLEGTDRSTGYIQSLGVRRPWRRRGLARALLHHTFSELIERGYERCALHVDSDSQTGATRVYEKAGMKIAECSHVYELELRPGINLSNRGQRS
ncbi:GNAT family N-acetyltransferase [Candidatus Bipolaricaulota bacterium]|nr:GNAT family N-acetyltransferase [Candidatus Bipolaricaulota bacterium]